MMRNEGCIIRKGKHGRDRFKGQEILGTGKPAPAFARMGHAAGI
jgi:hypothetical protein